MSGPPPRPVTERPEDIGFTKQEMTRWLSPAQLVDTGLRVVLSGIFGTYADKREFQEGRPSEPCDLSDGPELWFDYISDLGDGFNPTYALATLLAAEKLDLTGGDGDGGGPGVGMSTQRGRLLVMGGDQVYPTADIESYRNRLIGPYRAALPYTATDHPQILALPGNHDWYDGLTAFTRVFCQGSWIGGWTTGQRRSYFAAALPQRWWLFGIDIQFDTYIDEPQIEYFRDVIGPRLEPGDSVILCSAKPNWVTANEDKPDAYDTLDYFQRIAIEPFQAEVRLNLTGDTHHYARYQETGGDAQLITAGGGGAFLSDSHHLPEHLLLPPPDSPHTGKRPKAPASFDLKTCYPTKAESRRIALGAVTLARKNPSFVALLAGVYVLYAWTVQSALRRPGQSFSEVMHGLSFTGIAAGLARSPLALVVTAVLVLGLAGFTKATSKAKKYLLGGAHALVHLVAVVAVVRVVDQVLDGLHGLPYLAGYLALVGVAGGLIGSLVMAAYLYLADRFFNCNANELFAAQRIEDKKNFLRLHIDPSGLLTVYPVKVDRVPTKWRLRTGGRDGDPWFEADGNPPRPALIEEPIRIHPARR
ncbi:MAG: metallophosphoesterase [Acidimicrobiales bacterium]